MDNLEQPGSRIPDVWSIILRFSLTVTFHLTPTEIELKNLLPSTYTLALSNVLFSPKMLIFSDKKMLISAKSRGSWY